MSLVKDKEISNQKENRGKEDKKSRTTFITLKRKTTHGNNNSNGYDIIGSFGEIKKEKLTADIWNELDSQTAQFDHIFTSSHKAKNTLPQSMHNTDKQKTKFKCPPQSIENISSSSSYRFLSRIPKPHKDYAIRYDKYPDMPSRIPRCKL